VQVNDEYAAMLGYDPATFTESHAAWIQRLHPEERDAVVATFDDYLAGRIPRYRVEHRQRARSGEWRWILSLGTIVSFDERGKPLRLLGTTTDITERKRTEQALRESERKYREVVENANSILLRWNPQGIITFMNEYGLAFFGFAEAELIGRHVVGTIVPRSESGGRDLEPLMSRICTDPKSFEFNINENVRRDGRRVWVAWTNKAVIDDDGRLVEIFSVGTDISERKRAEDALRESEERFAAFMRHLPGFAFLKDHERRVLFVNERFESDFGLAAKDWVGKTNDEIWPGEVGEKIRRDDEAVLAEGKAHAVVEVVPTRGEPRTYRTIKFPIPRPDGKPWLGGIAVDITELRRAEQEKERLQAQLLQAQKMESIGRLAGGVAHDFNNMLQAILGHVELALTRTDPSPPVQSCLKAIGQAARHSADLTRQLLAFARKQTVAPKVLDLNDIVAGLLKMLRRLIGEDVDLVVMPGAGLWRLKIDPMQVEQILVNLCVNARDAIQGVGSVTIETQNVTLNDTDCANCPGTVRAAIRERYRLWHGARGSGTHFRALLYHQGGGARHRPGTVHRVWGRPAKPGMDNGREPTRQGLDLQALSAQPPGSGDGLPGRDEPGRAPRTRGDGAAGGGRDPDPGAGASHAPNAGLCGVDRRHAGRGDPQGRSPPRSDPASDHRRGDAGDERARTLPAAARHPAALEAPVHLRLHRRCHRPSGNTRRGRAFYPETVFPVGFGLQGTRGAGAAIASADVVPQPRGGRSQPSPPRTRAARYRLFTATSGRAAPRGPSLP
jgi:PAS domain S-box-containing protein